MLVDHIIRKNALEPIRLRTDNKPREKNVEKVQVNELEETLQTEHILHSLNNLWSTLLETRSTLQTFKL